jgi:carbonic anhydrase
LGPRAAETLHNLIEGNLRFLTGTQRHPNQSPARRYEIAARQEPFAAILTCADSRIAPELILDQGLGDLFLVRVAGNVADPLVIETLEFAVKDVGIRLILVLGHTRCAAITAAVNSELDEADSPMRADRAIEVRPPDER